MRNSYSNLGMERLLAGLPARHHRRRMNIWSLLGVSVGVIALFSIAVHEMCRTREFYEAYRWFVIVGFGWLGVFLFIWGRIKITTQARRRRARIESGEITAEEAEYEMPFFFLSSAYWGVMLIVFGAVLLMIAPDPGAVKTVSVLASEPVPAAPAPPPVSFPELNLQGLVYQKVRASALINGKTYFEGDTIGDVLVKAIHPKNVVVELNGEEKTLDLLQ
jgi:hypothetical protein